MNGIGPVTRHHEITLTTPPPISMNTKPQHQDSRTMESLLGPKSGIVLLGAPNADTKQSKLETISTQVMRLDLAEGMLSELLKSVRSGGKGVHVSFGKTPVSLNIIVYSLATYTAVNTVHAHRHSTTGLGHIDSLPCPHPSPRNSTTIRRTAKTSTTLPAGSVTISNRRRSRMSQRELMPRCSS